MTDEHDNHARADAAGTGTRLRSRLVLVVLAVLMLLIALWAVPRAHAQTYTDVPSGYWARGKIDWVTDKGVTGRRVLDDYGDVFKPEKAVTRAQLAQALVLASGHWGDVVDPAIDVADVPPEHPYYHAVQVALSLHLMTAYSDGFHPDSNVLSYYVDRSAVRMLRVMYSTSDWTMLSTLDPVRWKPNAEWKTGAPRYLPYEVAARYIGLRENHLTAADARELSPRQAMPRAEVAAVIYRALHASSWRISGVSAFKNVVFPKLTLRQKTIIAFALKYVGYPYVWAGEYPTKDSPYGTQAHGGFDCSGFVWWVLKMKFGYTINERSTYDMCVPKPHLRKAALVPGDIIFFGSNARSSTPSQVYHAGIYLGNGWFIHSTGSQDGVSIASINWDGWSWKTDFAWGRRVLKSGQFIAP